MNESNSSTSRARILAALRANRAPFPDAAPRPGSYLPVTRSTGEGTEALIDRFRLELERRFGKVYTADTPAEAIAQIVALIGDDRQVLAWDNLPLPGLTEALSAQGVRIIVPEARGEGRVALLETYEPVRVGVTGADAAFANTGTLALIADGGHGRLPSLLPPVHIALLDRARLYPHVEAWVADRGREALRTAPSIAFVTGPSSTGDIEQVSVLGAHGPGAVHVIIF